MAAPQQKRGLEPVRRLDNMPPNGGRLYDLKGKNTARIYKGDIVYLDGDGIPQAYTATASANTPALGVVTAVFDKDSNSIHPKPRVHQTSQGPGAPVSAVGFLLVNDDPMTVYRGLADVTASADTHFGLFVGVSAGTPVTAAGQSGVVIKMTAPEVSAGGGKILKILGHSQDNVTRNSSYLDIEVVIGHHHFNTHNNTI